LAVAVGKVLQFLKAVAVLKHQMPLDKDFECHPIPTPMEQIKILEMCFQILPPLESYGHLEVEAV